MRARAGGRRHAEGYKYQLTFSHQVCNQMDNENDSTLKKG